MTPSLATSALESSAEPPPPDAGLERALDAAIVELSRDAYDVLAAELHQASMASGFTWERRDGGYVRRSPGSPRRG